MSSVLLKNAIIVTMNDEIINGDLLIEDDYISKIGKDLAADSKVDKTIDCQGKIVMPGLVNCHSHVAKSLFRGFYDECRNHDELTEKMFPFENKLEDDDLYTASSLSILEMIKSGTTCFNDAYYSEAPTAQAAVDAGIRGFVSKLVYGDGEEATNLLMDADDLHYAFDGAGDGLVKVNIGLSNPYKCSSKTISKSIELAEKLKCMVQIPVLEDKKDIQIMQNKYGKKTIDYLKDANAFNVKTILPHGVWLDEYDLIELQRHNTSVINCPVSDCKKGAGIADMKFLMDGGINVALGTDGIDTANTLDMFEEIKNVTYSQKVLYKQSNALRAQKALEMATINGAKALGLENEIGTLEVGKKADIIIVDINKPHLIPLRNVYSTLAYSCTGSDIETVIINGKIVMEDRKVLTIDEKEIMKKAEKVSTKLFK